MKYVFLFSTLNSLSPWLVALNSNFCVSSPKRRPRVQAIAFCLCYPGTGKYLKGRSGRKCRAQFNKCFFSTLDLGFSYTSYLGFSMVPSNIVCILSAFTAFVIGRVDLTKLLR